VVSRSPWTAAVEPQHEERSVKAGAALRVGLRAEVPSFRKSIDMANSR
jgi:hypothetical protein